MAVPNLREFKIEDLPSIWDLDDKTEWLVEGLIPQKSVVLLSGDSGVGKSTLALALANAVATGAPFLGRRCDQREVLIVDRENGTAVYGTRIERLRLLRTDNLHVWGLWLPIEPQGPDAINILQFAQEYAPLIIFDSLISFHDGDESNATDTRDYMQDYRRLAAAGATVIVLHHTGKGEGTKNYRGSSDIKASVDVAYVLIGQTGLVNLKLRPFKSREGDMDEICLRYHDGQFIEEVDPDIATVVEYLQEHPRANGSAITAALDGRVPGYRLRKLLKQLSNTGVIVAEKGNGHSYLYSLK